METIFLILFFGCLVYFVGRFVLHLLVAPVVIYEAIRDNSKKNRALIIGSICLILLCCLVASLV